MTWPALLERRSFVCVLVAVWALAYLPHLGTRTLRLEEGRRATPAREMLASNDFIRPTLYGETYLNKPPMFFWLVAAVGSLLGGVSPLATRIPSVLSALGCAFVALRFAPNALDRSTRALAALFVLATSALLDKGTLGEIEATLCFLVSGSLKLWWDGQRPPSGQTLSSWLMVGLLLGLSGLLKGPAGPVIFYMTIVPYLVWARRWRVLFSAGHLACLVLAILPAATWVGALLNRDVISASALADLWGEQLGFSRSADAVTELGPQWSKLLTHYAEFPFQVAGMLFPAVLWFPFAIGRRWSESRGIPCDVRRFLLCGATMPFVVFYLYPESRARHLMPAAFPTAILAAVVIIAMTRAPGRWCDRGKSTASNLALIPALMAVGGVLLAAIVQPDQLVFAVAGLVVGVVWSGFARIASRSTPRSSSAIALAANMCALPLAAWFIINLVVVPWRAPLSTTTDALTVAEHLPPDEVVFTTRTFPYKGERYYNMQFHLAKEVRAADNLDSLKSAAPCIAVVIPEERALLEGQGVFVDEIGRMGGRDGQPQVHVIRLMPIQESDSKTVRRN